ncbi:GspH/FimT family pseudopilin [Cereibacter sphaeroides]|nr:GspH/FimT family pseudopilin [Cereibacter sphaeroides]
MRISPAGKANNPRPAARGFTLIELLVVVTILAVLASGVGLSAGGLFARPGGASAAERLQQADRRARDFALFGNQRTGLFPRRDGWQLARLDGEGLWRPEGAVLRVAGASAQWTVAGRNVLPGLSDPGPRDVPPVQFAPDGGSTPFVLTLQMGSDRLRCSAPAGEGLTCAAP